MNKVQLIVMWLIGLAVSGILWRTGAKLLVHSAANPETLAAGYPFALLAGTIWTYVIPVVLIGIMLMITFKDR